MLLDEQELKREIGLSIDNFYNSRLTKISNNLDKKIKNLLKQGNPYLNKAKAITSSLDLIKEIIDANLHSSDEELFGHVFEHIAFYVVRKLYNGTKGIDDNIDYEYIKEGVLYLVQQKSSWVWGNDSQVKKLAQDFAKAKLRRPEAQCYNLCSFGTHKPSQQDGYIKMVGQDTWEFLTDDPEFYVKLINWIEQDPTRFDKFHHEYDNLVDHFLVKFKEMKFSNEDGSINWEAWTIFNSKKISPNIKRP